MFTTISINYMEAAEDITRHLILSGRRNIAFLGFNETSSVDGKKLDGWKKALMESGLLFTDDDVYKYGKWPLKDAITLFSKNMDTVFFLFYKIKSTQL